MRASILVSSAATILALLLPKALSVPLSTTVLTPGGYHNLHEVPAGGRIVHVGAEIHVINVNGELIDIAFPGPTTTAAAPQPEATGWVAFASWNNKNPSPISSFNTTWTVPPAPATENGQVIFLFNSIEPSAEDAILQPVLQWGRSAAGGGNYWSIESWCMYPRQKFYTPLEQVEVGQTLIGSISLVGQNGSNYTYNSQFDNRAGTWLTVNSTAQLTWATETPEVYGVTNASDFPAGSTEFSGINLALLSEDVPTVVWHASSNAADNVSTTVNMDGATDAKITIAY
ncbi:hypothetical protein C8R44DRAFT_890488 [Mycena epipterygia]|nr:hypothetical protein C8R44DRAFT_890488 [Mycena epipterygia]